MKAGGLGGERPAKISLRLAGRTISGVGANVAIPEVAALAETVGGHLEVGGLPNLLGLSGQPAPGRTETRAPARRRR